MDTYTQKSKKAPKPASLAGEGPCADNPKRPKRHTYAKKASPHPLQRKAKAHETRYPRSRWYQSAHK